MLGLRNYGLSELFESLSYTEASQKQSDKFSDAFHGRVSNSVIGSLGGNNMVTESTVAKCIDLLPTEISETTIQDINYGLGQLI